MPGPQFNPDDKPTFGPFDLPTICTGADSPERECCDPCTDWIFCLKRSLYELTLDGFELEEWLAGHWLSSLSQYKADQTALKFSGDPLDETFIFDGVYIAEPPSPQGQAVACPLPEREDACTHTHRIRAERTLSTSSLEGDEVKRFGLNVNTECVVVEGVKYLKFVVNLVWQGAKDNAIYEPAIENSEIDPPPPCSTFCPPKEETPYEPLAGSDWFCCPILVSDLIPVASITSLADLDAVTLNPLPPATATLDSFYGLYFYDTGIDTQLCLQTSNVWVSCIGVLLTDCLDGGLCCLFFAINDCPTTIDGAPAGAPTGEIEGSTALVYAGGCGAEGGVVCSPAYCISKPIEYYESGAYTLKVIDGKCRTPADCGSCVPDEEKPTRRQAINPGDVKFTWTAGASCAKTFTPIVPACLTIVKVYWSWGEVSTGLDTVNHTIVNIDPENPLRVKETISAIFLDDRGCIYCWTDVVECGCCPGVSGSLSIEQTDEDGCEYELTASVTTTEDCPDAFVEYQLIGMPGADPAFEDCPCNEIDPDAPEAYCMNQAYSGTLRNGESTTVEIAAGARLRYRVWDAVCGCASEWVEIALYCTDCDCCLGKIVNIRLTLAGVGNVEGSGCAGDCDVFNRVYELEPFGVDEETCIWSLTTDDLLVCSELVSYSVQIFVSIGCSNFGGNPAILDSYVSATLNAGAGGLTGEKYNYDSGSPIRCDELSGLLPIIDRGSAECDFDGATMLLEIITTEPA